MCSLLGLAGQEAMAEVVAEVVRRDRREVVEVQRRGEMEKWREHFQDDGDYHLSEVDRGHRRGAAPRLW